LKAQRIYLILLGFFLSFQGNGQVQKLIQSNWAQLKIEKQQSIHNPNFHSAVRPYLYNDLKKLFKDSNDSIHQIQRDSLINAGIDYIEIKPQVYLTSGSAHANDNIHLSSTLYSGLSVTASLKNKLAINASAYYGTQNTHGWDEILLDSLNVFPNWGVARNGGIGRNFDSFEGYVSYSPDHIFNLEIGRGRHFFGDGINSLFLSSNANAYPYFKLTTTVWNIKYTNLYSWQKDIRINPFNRDRWLDKFTATHFLSWNVSPQVSLSLFETIIWAARDVSNNRGFDLNYLNPVIFYRPIEFSLGSADNAIIGFGMKYIASDNLSFYGQWMLDEFLLDNFVAGNGWWANKFGLQLGNNYFNAFNIDQLTLKTEFNLVRPFTYSHGNVTQNYGHFNQPLAHPLGSNFYNLHMLATYPKGNWLIEGEFIYSHFGRDSLNVNLGGNLYQSYVNPELNFGNEIAQGVKHNLLDVRLTANYILSKRDDFRLFADFRFVNLSTQQSNSYLYLQLGARISWPDYR